MIEYRTVNTQMRAEHEEGNGYISGYGVVFNSDSQPLYIYDGKRGFVEVVERITPDSLRETDMSDVLSAFNHDFSKVMGRTTSGTLTVSTDERGVFYRAQLPNTTYARDVLELVRRGDLAGSSFVFTMDYEQGYDFSERADGTIEAIPKKIEKIYEMGPVTNPAYLETGKPENRSSFLEDAVKRHLAAKDKQERTDAPKTEERNADATQGPDTTDNDDVTGGGPDAGQQERTEPIVYPFPKGYWTAKKLALAK